ncbi:probable cytochrome P450 6a23 [Tribolium castaneum]|uniref:Cytochrome P450 6BN1 n=1 Tax=Tribolium castaneum TaxID=7070 RepID=D2A5J0_TRICA|nr:PREDICTED: probable cytochrome P450 6a23 [Tribolium castaneum]EFA05730.1 cytochrome P450 6BN1 [Tribolium castaneum]|eukprot:XP_969048.1 PREDICTED: probable cytochrome P450 6a23 [Tribolium castaneum]
MNTTIEILTIIILTIFCFYKWKFSYWKSRKIPYLDPKFPFGNVSNPFFMKEKVGMTLARFYNDMKQRGWKYGGFYFGVSPICLIVDPDLIKNIVTRDFEHFVDRGVYFNEKDDPLSGHLANLDGQKWKNMRRKLNPTFSASKTKNMFPIVKFCVENMMEKVKSCYENAHKCCNINEVFPAFSINVICSCAFGLQEENALFKAYADECVSWTKYKYLVQILATFFDKTAKRMGITTVPRNAAKFFMKVVTDSVKYREENDYVRSDFMQLLIEMKKQNQLTIEEIAAQCFVFFIAGFETSSATLTFALYELAKNQNLQNVARDEILANCPNEITYDSLADLKFLDQVVDETLRKYPPLLYVTRQCVKNYKIPDEDVVIEKGTLVAIPISALHSDEEFYPKPETFEPERFSKTEKSLRHPYTFLPFGEGPRMCIGKRFGLLEVKLALTCLLKNYKFSVNCKTKEPLAMRVDTVVLAPKDEIWLDLEKI